MMLALLLQAVWYNFLHSPDWRSSWNWRMFIFDNFNGVQFIPSINFVTSLNYKNVNPLNVWRNQPENKKCFLRTKHSHNEVCKVSILRNLLFGHMRFTLYVDEIELVFKDVHWNNRYSWVFSSMMVFLIIC